MAVCVPNVYSDKQSDPLTNVSFGLGTMKCTLPFILQMEQLHRLRLGNPFDAVTNNHIY